MAVLDQHKQLVSDLWLDAPDAGERIAERERNGSIDAASAAKLRQFSDLGFTSLRLSDIDALSRGFENDIDRLWKKRPRDLAVAAKAGDRVSFRDFDEKHRAVGYRIADPHGHSDAARRLYLHDEIFSLVELILGQQAVSFQSLYFQFGSEQSLHRDPMFVVTRPASHLVAAWIALEDITAASGPLQYVPGSHRLPWYEFDDDTITVNKSDTEIAETRRKGWPKHREQQIKEMGLDVQSFTCKRGDVFLWHGSLLHGGVAVTDPAATRRSYVIHYSTARTYESRRASMLVADPKSAKGWRGVSGETSARLRQGDHEGIDNPLRHARL